MKKLKLLIPALSIASVGAVVVPMVTSCSSSAYLSTSDINYVGSTHDLVESTDGWNQTKATEEYYKDVKIVAEDALTGLVQNYIKEEIVDVIEDNKNVSYNFKISIDNITLGESKEATIKRSSGDVKIKGYLLSGKISMSLNMSYDEKINEKTSAYSQIHITNNEDITMTFKNCFTSIAWSGSSWQLYVEGCKDASADWEYNTSGTMNYSRTSTMQWNGSQKTTTSSSDVNSLKGAKYLDSDQSILMDEDYIPSNYLSKVAYKE